MLDRSAILSDAHARTRELGASAFYPQSYAATFPMCLRAAWRDAKCRARQEAAAAALAAEEEAEAAAMPVATVARVADLRRFAETMPFTNSGHERRRAILADADDIAQAARCIMIPAQDTHHVAH